MFANGRPAIVAVASVIGVVTTPGQNTSVDDADSIDLTTPDALTGRS
jgi:hypothetical protein